MAEKTSSKTGSGRDQLRRSASYHTALSADSTGYVEIASNDAAEAAVTDSTNTRSSITTSGTKDSATKDLEKQKPHDVNSSYMDNTASATKDGAYSYGGADGGAFWQKQ